MVVSIMSLWLPILVSAVLVFVASSIIHMFLGYHNTDFAQVPNEGEVMAALRPFNLPPGDYVIPYASSSKERQTEEFNAKMNQGPVAFMTVYPSEPFKMGASLIQWFIYCVVVSIFAAYIAGRTLGPGEAYLPVFRIVGTVAFVGYAVALWQITIWFKKSWMSTAKSTFDGLVYGLLTAGAFGWLWPS